MPPRDGEILHRRTAGSINTHLESQTNRDATPALGTLDRVLVNIRETEDETNESAGAEALADAQEHTLSFLYA